MSETFMSIHCKKTLPELVRDPLPQKRFDLEQQPKIQFIFYYLNMGALFDEANVPDLMKREKSWIYVYFDWTPLKWR